MDKDESLQEFIRILGCIKGLIGDAALSGDESIDLVETIESLRLAGNNEDADELAELCERADELKAQHQAQS